MKPNMLRFCGLHWAVLRLSDRNSTLRWRQVSGRVLELHDIPRAVTDFEDLGVAAYKGKAGTLMGNEKTLLRHCAFTPWRRVTQHRSALLPGAQDDAFDSGKSKFRVL